MLIILFNVISMNSPEDAFLLSGLLQSHVYGYARCPEDEQQDCDQHHARRFPRGPQDTRRVPDPDPELRECVHSPLPKQSDQPSSQTPPWIEGVFSGSASGRGTAVV